MKSWLQKNDVDMFSTRNEGKFVVAERFIRTLKNEIYRYMPSVSKNMYIDKLDDIVNKYNNTYHGAMKKSSTCIDFDKKNNKADPKLKLVIMLEYQ